MRGSMPICRGWPARVFLCARLPRLPRWCSRDIIKGVSKAEEQDPADPLIRYALSWPRSLAAQVAKVARADTMPIAVWVRMAIREKLERAQKGDRT